MFKNKRPGLILVGDSCGQGRSRTPPKSRRLRRRPRVNPHTDTDFLCGGRSDGGYQGGSSLSGARLPLKGTVDRWPGHREHFREVADAVVAAVVHPAQFTGLPIGQLGLLPAELAPRAHHGHPLPGAHPDQVALELGGRGLFTSELVRALEGGFSWSDTDALMAEVARRVTARARRAGRTQTPVWAGRIKGGIPFPPLRRGSNYAAESPDTSRIVIGSPIHDLSAFGLPPAALDAWASRFSDLNALQLSAVNDYRVLDGRHLLTIAPTTSGKTFIGELAAARAIVDGRKAVFLLPYKALANEKFEEFQRLYGRILGMRVVQCTGDYGDQAGRVIQGQFDLALLTYEMFLSLTCGFPELLPKLGLVVIDEAQFISDGHRGITVELLITMLRMARQRGIEPQVVALSAVIGGVNRFDDWLGCRTLYTARRPVPLHEGVLDHEGCFQYLYSDGMVRRQQLVGRSGTQAGRFGAPEANLLARLVRKLVRAGEKVLIFRNSKPGASGTALSLALQLGLPAAERAIKSLPPGDLSQASRDLRRTLRGGTAFHTSDLSSEERSVVEQEFREPEGPLRVLAATTTVAAGVNTPAETVIIVETQYAGPFGRRYSVATYKNMAGRAGRLGYAPRGRSILFCTESQPPASLFDRFVRGVPEPVRSSFKSGDLGTWILRLLAQVRSARPERVADLLSNTYQGFLESSSSPTWKSQLQSSVRELLEAMGPAGLLRLGRFEVVLTPLGLACGRSHLSLGSARKLIGLLQSASKPVLPAKSLLGLIHSLPETDRVYTPMSRKSGGERLWKGHVRVQYGKDVAKAVRRGESPKVFQARCKRLAVLQAWIKGQSMAQIESEFSAGRSPPVRAGNVRAFADLARHHLSGAFEIALAVSPAYEASRPKFKELLARLEKGLPSKALPLLRLPARLDRGTYLALLKNGLASRDEVMRLAPERLGEIVGDAATKKILGARAPR